MTRAARIGILQAVAAAGFFSTGAVLVRWAQDLSPVEVTSLRLLLGGLLVAAAAWGSGERVGLAGGGLRRLIPIGLIAAAHFLTFIGSLYFTTVAHTLTLIYTAPLFLTRPVNGSAIAAVFAMALLPSALGHTLYNAALRRLHPSIPNLIAAQEVTGSILLAWLLLHEAPPWNAVAGAGITLVGVGLVLR